jgi:hypothetical protein
MTQFRRNSKTGTITDTQAQTGSHTFRTMKPKTTQPSK